MSAIHQKVEDLEWHLSQEWFRTCGPNDSAYLGYSFTNGDSDVANKIEFIGATVGVLDINGAEIREAQLLDKIATEKEVSGTGVDKHWDFDRPHGISRKESRPCGAPIVVILEPHRYSYFAHEILRLRR